MSKSTHISLDKNTTHLYINIYTHTLYIYIYNEKVFKIIIRIVAKNSVQNMYSITFLLYQKYFEYFTNTFFFNRVNH